MVISDDEGESDQPKEHDADSAFSQTSLPVSQTKRVAPKSLQALKDALCEHGHLRKTKKLTSAADPLLNDFLTQRQGFLKWARNKFKEMEDEIPLSARGKKFLLKVPWPPR